MIIWQWNTDHKQMTVTKKLTTTWFIVIWYAIETTFFFHMRHLQSCCCIEGSQSITRIPESEIYLKFTFSKWNVTFQIRNVLGDSFIELHTHISHHKTCLRIWLRHKIPLVIFKEKNLIVFKCHITISECEFNGRIPPQIKPQW